MIVQIDPRNFLGCEVVTNGRCMLGLIKRADRDGNKFRLAVEAERHRAPAFRAKGAGGEIARANVLHGDAGKRHLIDVERGKCQGDTTARTAALLAMTMRDANGQAVNSVGDSTA